MMAAVKTYRWQCIECKCCNICGTSENDVSTPPRMIEYPQNDVSTPKNDMSVHPQEEAGHPPRTPHGVIPSGPVEKGWGKALEGL